MECKKTKELNYYIRRAKKVGLDVSIDRGEILVSRNGRCLFYCDNVIAVENVILVLEDIRDWGENYGFL